VARFAGVLAAAASARATASSIYMPMVPEALSPCWPAPGSARSTRWCSAASRANELAARIDDAKPKLIVSASCGIEPRAHRPYKPLLDAAIGMRQHKPERCLILQRAAARRRAAAGRDDDWAEAAAAAAPADLRAGRGHRSALHPLHLRHDRAAQGRGARQWRRTRWR
jgi:propionyl-CoA synthetase